MQTHNEMVVAHVNQYDAHGYTALMHVAATASPTGTATAKLLLLDGAMVMLTATDGMNAFKMALRKGNLQTAELIWATARKRGRPLLDQLRQSCYAWPSAACLAAQHEQVRKQKTSPEHML